MKKQFITLLFLLLLHQLAVGESYLVNGGQESNIRYRLVQQVVPSAGMNMLHLNFVIPQSFSSPTYNQRISALKIDFEPRPTKQQEIKDKRGNKIIRASWANPTRAIRSIVSFTALNHTKLKKINTTAVFPVQQVPVDIRYYLKSTSQVGVDDPQIRAKARELTRGAKTQFDAVQRILSWVIDHMRYVLTPSSYDAQFSYRTGKGNCQNYSHLAAALMRSVGIPVRIVNGVTLKQAYEIKTPRGSLLMKMAQGRHSWIEVYFPDLKWVPFDPQQTQLFVSNRFIRIEVGLDNNETKQDGLIRWSQSHGMRGKPQFTETIESDFQTDQVRITAEKQKYGPRKLLLTPAVHTFFVPYQTKQPEPPPPPKVSPQLMKQMQFRKRYVFGNLELPIRVDFADVRGPVQAAQGNQFEMKKNFMVETAEYVTSRDQYAQIFVLQKPMKLEKIGLALHKFGGSGMLWLEILEDNRGIPGKQIATSEMISVDNLRFHVGYDWQAFDFAKQAILLSPGKYWIALGFTGSPIINWFYSYGKPVGPQNGTRFKTILAPNWSKSLSFEFNYRVEGFIKQ